LNRLIPVSFGMFNVASTKNRRMNLQVSVKPVAAFREYLRTSTDQFEAGQLYDDLLTRLNSSFELVLQQVLASLAVPTLARLVGSDAAPALDAAVPSERAAAYSHLFQRMTVEDVARLWAELEQGPFSDHPPTSLNGNLDPIVEGIPCIGYQDAFGLDIGKYLALDKRALRQVLCLFALTTLTAI